jgi:purine-binding chemotaxis protein CheW
MDILAARKKAAEQAQARRASETAPPADQKNAPAQESPVHASAPPAVERVPEPAETEPVQPLPHVVSDRIEVPAGDVPDEIMTPEIEMLSFRLSGEEYAVMVSDVREVLKIRELTRVPNGPDYIQGVTSLRGTMLPVIDLCTRLGLKAAERNEKARIIVISTDNEDAGLIVDRVNGVIRTHPESIKAAPEHVEQGADFIRGIVRQGDKLHIVLDLHKAAVK